MSRRAKLIFITLFLLLGGVAAALTFLTRPKHPLRFTLAHQRTPETVFFGERGIPIEVLVENRSSRTILLHMGYIRRMDAPLPPATMSIDPSEEAFGVTSHISNAPPNRSHWILPPHGTTRVTFFCWELEQLDGNEITHYWDTPLYNRIVRAHIWLLEYTPDWLHPVIPSPSTEWEETPLEVPPNPFSNS